MSLQSTCDWGTFPVKQSLFVPASFVSGPAWFVAFASPAEMHWSKGALGWDFPVVRRIEEAGFETFVPLERSTVMRNGRRRELIRPLFGGYLFVRFDRSSDEWANIKHIQGVIDLLTDNDKFPIRVPDAEIRKFQRWEEAGVFDFRRGRSAFSEGDTVEIKEGPFAGFIAKVRSASPRKRVKLLLGALGELSIDPTFLAKV